VRGFGFTGDNLTGDRRVWEVDTEFTLGRFELAGEYFRGNFKPLNSVPSNDFDSDGYYVSFAGYVVPKKLQAAVKFESFDPNKRLGGNTTDEWVFGLNYFIKGNDLKLQLNYHLGNPAGLEDNQGRLVCRAQLLF
jgi:phosphate-selective porin OprO and OprP